jgi:glycosyltransferase involved in cell wall biosynthesis
MKSKLRTVWHISQFFWPPRGGQEYLILQMCSAAAEAGRWSVIVQPLNISLLRPSSYFGFALPPRTILLLIPTLSPIFGLLRRITKVLPEQFQFSRQLASDLSWRSFNWSLLVLNVMTRWWSAEKITIVHYHFHQPYFRNPNTIVFSHGVEWRRPPISPLDRQRLASLPTVVNDPYVKIILANDKDYIDEAKLVSSDVSINQKLMLIQNPVDTERFKTEAQSSIEKLSLRKIVMVRNVRPDRGIFQGIQAFLMFRSNPDFSDWSMDIYGAYSADDPYFLDCINLAGDQFEKSIRFHGNVRNSEVPLILSLSTVALVPSLELEGSSLAALEAMAAGVPCISTPIGGLKDLPTYKSRSTQGVDIGIALTAVVANFDLVRTEQLNITRRDYSLTSWKNTFLNTLSLCD